MMLLFKKNDIKWFFFQIENAIYHIPKKLKKIIKKCIEPNPKYDRYDNTLQIINELASINENLDIRYGRDTSGEFWEAPKNSYVYKVSQAKMQIILILKFAKTKDGKTTNCVSFLYVLII